MAVIELDGVRQRQVPAALSKARRDVFRDYALDGALLRFHPASGTHIRLENAATQHLRREAPRVAMFGITNKCNLSCDFCSRDVQRDSAWTVESAATVLRDLSHAGVLEVAFGGGEPFAFRGFTDLVQELHETTALALNVTTNGLLIRQRSFADFAGRFGQVRISIYDDPRWRDAAQVLSRHGQQWGANLLVDMHVLQTLPQQLAQLAAMGCHDVSLLSYIGPDIRKHLSAEGRSRLAAIVQDAPLTCRVSVCFGSTVPVQRLFDGADGGGDCGAGLDFVSITPDQRMQACSFQEGGLSARTAQEILSGWRQQRARLLQPSPRRGCAGRKSSGFAGCEKKSAGSEPSIRVWQAFSGNNSGECVMVAKFTHIADADAYVQQLLPGWKPEADYSPQWRALFEAQAVAGPHMGYGEMPRELLAMGRSVIAMGYGLGDNFPELRMLAWKQGANVLPDGIHSHDITLLAAVKAFNADDVRELAQKLQGPGVRAFLHGDVMLLALELMGADGELAEHKQLLDSQLGQRPWSAEVLSEKISDADMLEVLKRLGVEMATLPRLLVQFSGEDAEANAERFARKVSEAPVMQAGGNVLISGLARRKRLGVLAHRQGGSVTTLDEARLGVSLFLNLPQEPRTKGKRQPERQIDVEALREELPQSLRLVDSTASIIKIEQSAGYRRGAWIGVSTDKPELVLQWLAQLPPRFGAYGSFGVYELQQLAMAVRRLMADVRA